jgi:AraC-like DNA-binding protein
MLTEPPMTSVPTIQAKAVDKIVRAAAARAVKAADLYKAAKVNPVGLDDPDRRIPFAQVVALYEQAARLGSDDAFGLHVGETVDPKAFDVLGYSVINSSTLGDAFDRVVRYNFIWTNGSYFVVDQEPLLTRIVYLYLDESITERRHDVEMTFAALASLSRKVTNSDLSPTRITFQHDRPRDTNEHQRIFKCPVEFGAPANQYFVESAALALPIIKADPGLCAVLDRHAEGLIAKYPRNDGLVENVRAIIKDELSGGNASLERIANQLHMSGRTLQRKLREQGTSHQELLDQMRRDLAIRYLREPEMAICEVAYLLGFSESSALHRAFKRWTGRTPNEFRHH